MGKDEETDLWLRRKATQVFGENHKDRWTATKYQSRQPLYELNSGNILEETEELIKIFVTSVKTAEKKQK